MFNPTEIYTNIRNGNVEYFRNIFEKSKASGSDFIRYQRVIGTTLSMFHYAAYIGHANIVKLFVEIANFDIDFICDMSDQTALYIAVDFCNIDAARVLLEAGADPNKACGKNKKTIIYKAVSRGHKNMVELLLEYGADPNSQIEYWGNTPLYNVMYKYHDPRLSKYKADYIDIACILLRWGADPNKATFMGYTPINIKWLELEPKFLKFLIENGADPYIKNREGESCLEICEMRGIKLEEIDESYDITVRKLMTGITMDAWI